VYNLDDGKWVRLALLGALFLLTACGSGSGSGEAPEPPPPASFRYQAPPDTGDSWAVAAASAEGVSVAVIEDMMDAIVSGEYPVIDSIAVAYNGKLILHETTRTQLTEFDNEVGNVDPALHAVFSVSKSIASIAMGINIDQGNIIGVDVPYLSLFPYTSYENWDERKNDMTLHDVLSMRLGLDWNEFDPPYSDPANQMFVFYANNVDLSKGLLDLPMVAPPGSKFAYNTAAAVSLGQAIENTAPLALIDFGTTYLLAPLGITQVEALATPTGLPDLGRGLYFTTRDLLKFGQLYLDGGQWNQQQLVSSEWIAASTQAYTQIGWSDPAVMDWQVTGYGYQWWAGYFEFEGLQLESFAGWGYGQQWLMVVPELKLVVAVHSHAWEERSDQTNQVFNLIRRFVLPALPN
jgi:CubicO group peptidase (beta-lactamase class C family)